jgi:hypothetical protein
MTLWAIMFLSATTRERPPQPAAETYPSEPFYQCTRTNWIKGAARTFSRAYYDSALTLHAARQTAFGGV